MEQVKCFEDRWRILYTAQHHGILVAQFTIRRLLEPVFLKFASDVWLGILIFAKWTTSDPDVCGWRRRRLPFILFRPSQHYIFGLVSCKFSLIISVRVGCVS